MWALETLGPVMIFLGWRRRASEEWSVTGKTLSLRARVTLSPAGEPHRDE